MLEKEFEYYLANQEQLVKQYAGKFLLIRDKEVKGAYDTKKDAYFEGQNQFDVGTFLIQLCSPGNLAFTQTYYTQNVAF